MSSPWSCQLRRSRGVALLAVTVVVGALTGCGSGGEQGGSTDGGGDRALARGALTAEADAVCARYRSRFLDIKLPSNLTDMTGVARYATASHALLQARHAELAALTPDTATRSQWDAFITADQGNVDMIGRLEAAARTKRVAKIAQVTGDSQAVLGKAVAAADAVGATGCGSGPG